jgi:hypothetical protein
MLGGGVVFCGKGLQGGGGTQIWVTSFIDGLSCNLFGPNKLVRYYIFINQATRENKEGARNLSKGKWSLLQFVIVIYEYKNSLLGVVRKVND